MATRVVYNYKSADVALGGRIDELEEKLGFEEGDTLASVISDSVESAVEAEAEAREEDIETINATLSTMQREIDGAISTWFAEGVPTLLTEPASLWEDEEEYDKHLGDLYYDTQTGYCYRFQVVGDTYSWALIKDTEITTALSNAASAQAAADASVKIAQGAAKAGRHLVINASGQVTSDLASSLMLSNADGSKVYVLSIGEDGALVVSEVVEDSGD